MNKRARTLEVLLSWVLDHKNHFSHNNGQTEEERIKLIKPLGELALCCDLLINNGRFEAESRSLLKWAWTEMGEGNYLRNLLLARPDLLMVSSLYYSFLSNGFSNDSLLRIITKQCRSNHAKAIQYPYWRRLDLELAQFKLGILPKFDPDLNQTWSIHEPEPWLIDADSAYALTHEVFYLTDFGSNQDILKRSTREYIARWSPVWRDIYLEHDNLDIFAELLMVSSCIQDPGRYDQHYSIIEEVVGINGYLPGPKDGGKNLMSEASEGERCLFLKNYHTTLVGMMALSLENRS